jgi:serine/threonine protein kinase HipA of HipAB toxin-antitoxin module
MDLVNIIQAHCATDDRYRFIDYLIYNYLIGSSDSHAKNFSIFITPAGNSLAPMYDVASTFPYELSRHTQMDRLALPIGHERFFGEITDRHWAAFASAAGMDADRVIERVRELSQAVPDALHDALADVRQRQDADMLAVRLLPKVQRLCDAAHTNRFLPHQSLIRYTDTQTTGSPELGDAISGADSQRP